MLTKEIGSADTYFSLIPIGHKAYQLLESSKTTA